MMLRLEFLNLVPVSINQLYVNIPGQSRRFISSKGKTFKQTVENEVISFINSAETISTILSSFQGKKLAILIQIFSPNWYLKDGKTLRKIDISSCEKALVDSVFSAFNLAGFKLDDHQIFHETLEKKDSVNPSIVIVLSSIED